MLRFRSLLFALVAATIVALPACRRDDPAIDAAIAASLRTLTVQQVVAMQADAAAGKRSLHIYDSNEKDWYATARVPGAKWVAFNEVAEGDLPSDKGATLVFYCANEECFASHTAAIGAIKLGYTDVFIMPAGIMGWKRANLPTEKG